MEGDRQSTLIALSAHYTTNWRGGNNPSISLITAVAAVRDPKYALIGAGVTMAAAGVALTVVFQLAHCVQEADFPMPVTTTPCSPPGTNFISVHVSPTRDAGAAEPATGAGRGGHAQSGAR